MAIVAGLALGGGGGEEEPPPQQQSSLPVNAFTSGPVAVDVPEGYAAVDAVPEIPGLALDDAAAQGRGDRTIAIGTVDADDSTLLPGTLLQALGAGDGEVPDRTPVELGPDDLQAYRYAGLEPEGSDQALTLYVSPNSEGVAAVACLSPPGDAEAFAPECEGVADTLQVSAGKPFPVGPDPAYAKTLGAVFGTLERKVAKGRARAAPRRRAVPRPGQGGRGRPRRLRGRRRQAAQGGREPGGREHQPGDRGPARRRGGDVEEGGRRGAREGQGRLRPRGGRDPQGGAAPGPDAQGAAGRRVRALRLKVEKFTEAHTVE